MAHNIEVDSLRSGEFTDAQVAVLYLQHTADTGQPSTEEAMARAFELTRTLRAEGVVESISPQSVQRILCSQQLKPWRVHLWLSPQVPRDEVFREQVLEIFELYTRQLRPHDRLPIVKFYRQRSSIFGSASIPMGTL